ncbi:hypothetical protein GCM10011608_12100 [Micromonospora sonchi]|uniref:Uncharacterized protein n=1 Tax=Micromonospora sonchi TaxID=1763543 RepID=A0A917WUG1_9ACTN|nr:hypothetical protein [Micromonospora sonchi]GGM28970.1 hypothetical protein GCM10011608_12100 [Micromonospora sonchi]
MTPHPAAAPEATHHRPPDDPAHTSGGGPYAANGRRNGTAPPTSMPTTTSPTPPRTGGQLAPGSRTSTPMTRDALDADLVNAVRRTAQMRMAFYVLVLLVALVGQVTGAVQTLGISVIVAVPAVAALELGGVVVMANADVRRRLGERAIAARILSAAIAAGAVAFNWIVHPDHLVGGFYAGMSALGYLVWLMHAGNQRRDRLRATGDLPPTPPAYEVFGHWIRHPVITSRSRAIAKADGLDLYESMTAARAAIARERRDAAIATVLHRKIRAAVDPTTADIAVRVYDLNEIATRLAATADYNELTALLAADLAPERITTATRAGHRRRRWPRREAPAAAIPTPHPTSAQPQPNPPAIPPREQKPAPVRNPEPAPHGGHGAQSQDDAGPPTGELQPEEFTGTGRTDNATDGTSDDETDDDQDASLDDEDDDRDSEVPTATAQAVAYWLRREPNIEPERLAEKIGKSLRSVYRYLPPDYPRRPGIARERTRRRPGPARPNSQSE